VKLNERKRQKSLGKTILTYPTILTKILKERYPRSAMKERIPNTINNNKLKNPKWEKCPKYRCHCQHETK